FNGTARLYAIEIAKNFSISFTNGIASQPLNLTGEGFEITFDVFEIIKDFDFGVHSVGITNDTIISWDKIVVTLEAKMFYSHGTWVDINIDFEYLFFTTEIVNINTLKYNLLLSNFTERPDINWTHFQDYSFTPDVRNYNITSLYDFSTGLSKFEARYRWIDQGPELYPGNLTICWIDDEYPIILDGEIRDFGNGTIILIIDVTDDSKHWCGSGIYSVELWDKRPLVDQVFETKLHSSSLSYQVSPGVYRYFFFYTYDQFPSLFQFDYGEKLVFSISVTDNGTLNFPEWLEGLRNPHTFTTGSFSYIVNIDQHTPKFIKKNRKEIEVTFVNSSNNFDIKEGDTVISVSVQDAIWSGLNESSVHLIITDWSSSTVFIDTIMNPTNLEDKRSEIQFIWQGELSVFTTYQITVTVTDNAGNVKSRTLTKEVEDTVAPRVVNHNFKQTPDRKLKITVTIEETGGGIEYVMVKINDQDKWFNLTADGGGGAALLENITYSTIIPLKFEITNVIQPKDYYITIKVADKSRNIMEYKPDIRPDFKFSLSPLIFEPIVWIVAVIFLFIGIVVGIRITSKTVGYDMNKIIVESEKVSREVMLTNMDEYALGVTVNFFDQIQGPVPVIWEPPLLEDQEQVMLDLSDKSFSTLEFVGLKEQERSGTFDFSTGSYECTALGYSFAVENPEARGGKENLTIVLLLRKEWGDNLLIFQDELLEKLREIRKLIENQQPSSSVEKKARELREFVSRVMISFNRIYTGIDYEVGLSEE
ncbi:MAG: hypothetical protein ACFFDT_12475, partial [Candidatus Hodarchaeota archaeon]